MNTDAILSRESEPADSLSNKPKVKKTVRLKSLKAVFQTEKVYEAETVYTHLGARTTNPKEVAELFGYLRDETKEHFIALHLDPKNRIICFDRVSIGSLCASIVHPREVFKSALLSSAAALIFIHNHPSGDPTPSREDLEITTRLREGGELLGIRILDHVIIGDRHYSFADNGQ